MVQPITFVLGVFSGIAGGVAPTSARGFSDPDPVDLSHSEFLAHAAAKVIREVTGNLVFGDASEGNEFRTFRLQDPDAGALLLEHGTLSGEDFCEYVQPA